MFPLPGGEQVPAIPLPLRLGDVVLVIDDLEFDEPIGEDADDDRDGDRQHVQPVSRIHLAHFVPGLWKGVNLQQILHRELAPTTVLPDPISASMRSASRRTSSVAPARIPRSRAIGMILPGEASTLYEAMRRTFASMSASTRSLDAEISFEILKK